MSPAVRRVGLGVRLLATRRSWQLAWVVLGALAVEGVYTRSRDTPQPFGPVDGLMSSVELLRLYLPVVVVFASAIWVGEQLQGDHAREAYLAGDDPRASGLFTAAATALLGLCTAVIVFLLAAALGGAVWSHDARAVGTLVPPSLDVAEFPARYAFSVVLPVVWALLGCALGMLGRRGVTAAAFTGVFLAVCLLVERAATVHPVILQVHSLSPLGASNGLVLGVSVPDWTTSAQSVGASAAVVTAWAAASLIVVVATRWDRVLAGNAATVGTRPKVARRLVAYVGAAGLAVAAGVLTPPVLAEQIPWMYKSSWRAMVLERQTPADAVRAAIAATVRGDLEALHAAADSSTVPQLLSMREALAEAGDDVQVVNLTDAPEPGSVVVDMGKDEISRDGAVEPAPQLGFCARRDGVAWVIVSMSENGVTCE